MTSLPIELANARTARDKAREMYDNAIDLHADEYISEMWKVVKWLEERATALYNEWQSKGGTSDIDSLAMHPVDEAQQIEREIDETLHVEDLGTRTIVSGGEVLELGTTSGHDEVIF